MLGKILAALVGGLIISVLGSIIVGLSVGAGEEGGNIGRFAFFIFYIYAFIISYFSESSVNGYLLVQQFCAFCYQFLHYSLLVFS